MIGQRALIFQVNKQLSANKFPGFSIFVGPRGCGKKTLIKKITKEHELPLVEIPTTVEGVRNLVELMTNTTGNVYAIYDIDSLSQAGCNALLKVAEEPSANALIIATCENIENIPTTIRSRAVVYQFEEYSEEEKMDFCEQRGYPVSDFMLSVCDTLGDIELLNQYDIDAFKDFIDLVIGNIAIASGSNAFKIASKICLKGDEGYDFKLFLKAFSNVCVEYMMEKDVNNCLKFSKAVAITGNTIADLNIKSINKQMLFDTWLLDIRSAWA